ncbi:MAG: PEP-CTERM sorting domain-containing protein [Fimbriimonadales bacterium]|nr:PEP-CTERM sorting domain-containing protein [Fimbriimonadales bacterium]
MIPTALSNGAVVGEEAERMFSANYQDGSWSRITTLFRWGSNYANLVNVAYHSPSNQGARFIFTADTEYYVRLHSFQMGGWPNTDRVLPFLQVLVDGNPVLTQTNITISGSTANTFSFDPNVVKGGVIEIRFGGDWNVGIDNIGFSQEFIPEPASLLALGAGLAGLAGQRRRIR